MSAGKPGTVAGAALGGRGRDVSESAAYDAPLPRTKPRASPAGKTEIKTGIRTGLKTAIKTRPGAGPDVRATTAAKDPPPALATLTTKAFFTRVKARTDGIKGHEVRAVMEAVLGELGEALVAGEGVKHPALGTLKVRKHEALAGVDVVVCKLRRKKPGAKPKDPLAKPAEGG